MRSSHSLSGFTLIELLVVIAILGLLATMLMPAVTGANESAIKTADGNNLKQIMTMYIKHRTDTRQTWAYPKAAVIPKDSGNGDLTSFNGTVASAGSAATDVTHASLWELARNHDLSPDLFNSPAGEVVIETAAAIDDTQDWTVLASITGDITRWLNGGEVAYMVDWSAPKTAGTIRPTISNRDHVTLFGEKINVCFADSHLGGEKDFDVVGDGVTVYHLALGGSGATQDNILDGTGDGVGATSTDLTMAMGRGHRKRAMMK